MRGREECVEWGMGCAIRAASGWFNSGYNNNDKQEHSRRRRFFSSRCTLFSFFLSFACVPSTIQHPPPSTSHRLGTIVIFQKLVAIYFIALWKQLLHSRFVLLLTLIYIHKHIYLYRSRAEPPTRNNAQIVVCEWYRSELLLLRTEMAAPWEATYGGGVIGVGERLRMGFLFINWEVGGPPIWIYI